MNATKSKSRSGVTNATKVAAQGDRGIRIERVFDAPRERVWRALRNRSWPRSGGGGATSW